MTEQEGRGRYERDYVANAPLIRRLRSRSKLTTQKLATNAGVHYTTVNKIENGHNRSPHWDTLEKLAVVLRVDVDDIVIYPELADIQDISGENIQKSQDFIEEIPDDDEPEDEPDGGNT